MCACPSAFLFQIVFLLLEKKRALKHTHTRRTPRPWDYEAALLYGPFFFFFFLAPVQSLTLVWISFLQQISRYITRETTTTTTKKKSWWRNRGRYWTRESSLLLSTVLPTRTRHPSPQFTTKESLIDVKKDYILNRSETLGALPRPRTLSMELLRHFYDLFFLPEFHFFFQKGILILICRKRIYYIS